MSDHIDTTVPVPAIDKNIDLAAAGDPPEAQAETSAAEQTIEGEGDLKFSKEAFQERLVQAKRSAVNGFLKELGFEKAEQLQEWRQAADSAIQAERERARAKMSELEKLETDLQAEKIARQADIEARTEAEKQAEALRVQNHLHGLFMTKGIRNTPYALFRVEQALSKLGDEEELDEVAFIDELCADDMEAAALGLATTAPVQRTAETAPTREGPDPRPDVNDDEFDAMRATPEEMERRLAQLGFHG